MEGNSNISGQDIRVLFRIQLFNVHVHHGIYVKMQHLCKYPNHLLLSAFCISLCLLMFVQWSFFIIPFLVARFIFCILLDFQLIFVIKHERRSHFSTSFFLIECHTDVVFTQALSWLNLYSTSMDKVNRKNKLSSEDDFTDVTCSIRCSSKLWLLHWPMC